MMLQNVFFSRYFFWFGFFGFFSQSARVWRLRT
jgi:hypothetical protein